MSDEDKKQGPQSILGKALDSIHSAIKETAEIDNEQDEKERQEDEKENEKIEETVKNEPTVDEQRQDYANDITDTKEKILNSSDTSDTSNSPSNTNTTTGDFESKYNELMKSYNDLKTQYSNRFMGEDATKAMQGVTNPSKDELKARQQFSNYMSGKKDFAYLFEKKNPDETGLDEKLAKPLAYAKKAGESVAYAATSLPEKAKEAYNRGDFSSVGKIASGIGYGLGNAFVNNPIALGIEDLFDEKKENK